MQRPRHARRHCHGLPCQRGEQCPESRIRASSRREGATTPVEGSAGRARPSARTATRRSRVFAEATTPSQLFQYYLLDATGFQPNVFTTTIPGINDGTRRPRPAPTTTCPTIGAVRLALEPKPGLPTDPNDPGAFIDIFTDISGLFVINNESGWYEGWMIHDLVVPPIGRRAPRRPRAVRHDDADDADALARHRAAATTCPGNVFTIDGARVRMPSASDHFPDVQTNLVPVQLSMGAYNCLQQSDCHSYWEFNQYTDWVFPLYELPFTGGFARRVRAGTGRRSSRRSCRAPARPEPGRPARDRPAATIRASSATTRTIRATPIAPRDQPRQPRSPDGAERRAQGEAAALHPERARERDPARRLRPPRVVRARACTDSAQRLFDAYRAEVARIDENGDGIVSAIEADLEDSRTAASRTIGSSSPPPAFNRFAVTREINDGLLGAALRAEPARLGAARCHCAGRSAGPRLETAGRRPSVGGTPRSCPRVPFAFGCSRFTRVLSCLLGRRGPTTCANVHGSMAADSPPPGRSDASTCLEGSTHGPAPTSNRHPLSPATGHRDARVAFPQSRCLLSN